MFVWNYTLDIQIPPRKGVVSMFLGLNTISKDVWMSIGIVIKSTTHGIHVWYIYISHKHQPNVGKYTIHGWYGQYQHQPPRKKKTTNELVQVDSLCGARGESGESDAARRIKTEFFSTVLLAMVLKEDIDLCSFWVVQIIGTSLGRIALFFVFSFWSYRHKCRYLQIIELAYKYLCPLIIF